ncbi:response regulator transcription factor [Afifella sp. IM 167]|uniref:response regulator transcription factor n=1 Tax=Afifella sp. IM 167 TaxID=2033586 RepID=UPI001CCEA1A5|nr:response regulator transcription factor [Afifella sp. IM 167]MBZ8134442.1 helix-turn-helix transcriptional regulator [Afifella sp. IM 167]
MTEQLRLSRPHEIYALDMPLEAVAKEFRAENARQKLIVVDSRLFSRECLCKSLSDAADHFVCVGIESSAVWESERSSHADAVAVILSIGARRPTDPVMARDITDAVRRFAPIPVLLLAESEDLTHVVRALNLGAKGYIPSSVSIEVCVQAVRLARAGGTYVPATALLSMGRALERGEDMTRPLIGIFTHRQAQVVMALRRGKANKVIAYELNMQESTVKVHIRNIMRKLRASNRTEVAYKLNDLLPPDYESDF